MNIFCTNYNSMNYKQIFKEQKTMVIISLARYRTTLAKKSSIIFKTKEQLLACLNQND